MSRTIFRFQRGEPITVGREVLSGDPAGYSVRAMLKPSAGYTVPSDEVAPVATFESQFVAASGAVPAHWLLWIPAEVAERCLPGAMSPTACSCSTASRWQSPSLPGSNFPKA